MQADLGRIAAVVTLVVLALAALASLAVAGRGGEFDEHDWRILGTLWAALLCGSAALGSIAVARRRAYATVSIVGVAIAVTALAVLLLAIWRDSVWDDGELLAKSVATAVLGAFTVLLIVSLRIQVLWTSAVTAVASLVVSALIVLTAVYALVLLWTWDAPFFDGDGGGEDVVNWAPRLLLALFALTVLSYLALPVAARLLPTEAERDT